ncbi:Protein SON [Armadillidium vulgare]|nr:Protein SON [Armadillidium vulgare]
MYTLTFFTSRSKGKMIVIKNLKESSVLQQAEVAQQNKPKVSENRIENNTQQNNDVKKEDNIEKTSKDGKEKPEPENLLTAFKKSKKEKEEADKEKKDVKKSSKSRSRSRSISRKRSRSRSRGAVTKPQGKRKRSRSTSRSRKRRSRSRDRYKKRSRSRSRSKRSASRDRYRGGRRSRSGSFCKQLVSKGDYSENELSDPSLSPDERESFSSRHHHPFAVKDKSEWVPVEKDESKDGDSAKVFPDDTARDIDISQLVSTRLNAMRRLQDNPTDKEAMKILSSAQKDMQNWALSKQVPGQFTGSTGARILSAEELSSGYQAWAKKGQFINASPVTSHFGMKILQKMGWNPGEGLGKDKKGSLIPLLIDVKMDKRGLTAANEVTPRRQAIPLAKTLQGKHPVSALVELCSKRKWGPPEFEIVFDSGPDHKKNFLIQVHVNNQTFKTSCAASTKKIAKANAAAACLQALGLIPEDGAAPVKSQETLNTTSQLPTTDPSSTSPSTEQPTGDGAQTTEAPSKEGSQDSSQGNYTAAVAATDDAVPQYSTDNSHTTTAPYVSDGTMTQYRNDSSQDGTMSQYRADTSQAANQYDSSAMSQYQSQYSSDGTQSMAQYADSQTMGGYSAEAMAQYSTNGTQDMSQYQANSTEAMAQYSSTDPQAMAQYAQSAVAGYSTDGSQTSIAQYSQAYQQYSAEAIQAYQQQYSSSGGSQNQSGAFTFPQPPRSLTHGITSENGGSAEAGSANQGNRGDSSTSTDSQSHSGSGSQSDPYRNSYGTGYSSSSSYNQMQYYDGSYQQGSQY